MSAGPAGVGVLGARCERRGRVRPGFHPACKHRARLQLARAGQSRPPSRGACTHARTHARTHEQRIASGHTHALSALSARCAEPAHTSATAISEEPMRSAGGPGPPLRCALPPGKPAKRVAANARLGVNAVCSRGIRPLCFPGSVISAADGDVAQRRRCMRRCVPRRAARAAVAPACA
jgi:hypothetical protein